MSTEESALKNAYLKDMTSDEIAKSGYHIKEAGKELARLYGKALENIPDGNRKSLDIVNKLSHDLENMTDAELYALVAGEVEARNVARRMDMTPDERRRTLASETEDVARRDQIFLGYSNGYSADSGNEKESIDIINKYFNKNLEDYEKGNVPFGTRFYLGMPSRNWRVLVSPISPLLCVLPFSLRRQACPDIHLRQQNLRDL